MTTIDLTPRLDEIRDRYPRSWCSKEAQEELRALWGDVECNDYGVIKPTEIIRIDLPGEKLWHGVIEIARTPNGWHAMSIDYSHALGGGCSSPSVWNRQAFTDRDEALQAGYEALIRAFESIKATEHAPVSQGVCAAKMIAALKGRMLQTRQMEFLL
jgi:hypothetical protein